MEKYKFTHKDKVYELSEENLEYFLNDEENEITGIEPAMILELLYQHPEVEFEVQYYSKPCEVCLAGKAEKQEYFNFLEYHFYLFTKENKYVMSSISKEYENITFTQLLREGKIDNSYVAILTVCEHCGAYAIEIEQCDM